MRLQLGEWEITVTWVWAQWLRRLRARTRNVRKALSGSEAGK